MAIRRTPPDGGSGQPVTGPWDRDRRFGATLRGRGEMADAPDLGSGSLRSGGSSPLAHTTLDSV